MTTQNRIYLVTITLYLALNFAHAIYLGKTVYGDGRFYFSWLRSTIIDHDLDFSNEYKVFSASQPPVQTGLPGNKYSIGPAIAWAYPYLFTHQLFRQTGFEFFYQLASSLTTVIYVLIALILLGRLLTRRFPKHPVLTAITALAWTTNLLFYGAIDTVNSHGLSFFAAVIFLTVIEEKPLQYFLAGSALGFIALIRPQDTLYGLLLLPYLTKSGITRACIGFAVTYSPALVTGYLLNGTVIPAYLTGGEGFALKLDNLIGILFAPQGGLFFRTPVLLLGAWGIIRLTANHRGFPRHYRWLLPTIICGIIVISSWSTPHQGASYGSRMTVGLLPLFGIGLAEIFQYFYKLKLHPLQILVTVILPLAIINLLEITYFLATN